MGSIYQRGKVWWVKYYRDGKPYRESSRSRSKRKAEKLLKRREGAVASGTFAGLEPERITLGSLMEDLLTDYKINRKRNTRMIRSYKRRLLEFFGERTPARNISTDRIRAYVADRQKDERAAASINRELAALRRAFNLGKEAGKVVNPPHIPMLKEDNVRIGWFSQRDYRRLLAALPTHLRPVVAVGFHTGMRKGEILGLTWDRVDLHRGFVRLQSGSTKNGRGRTIPLCQEVVGMLRDQLVLRKRRFPGNPNIFFNHRSGAPIQTFRKAWATACGKVGLEGMLFHDLRRSAVRNLVRAGVPENTAMAITGHRTRSVFDRYDIVSEHDLKAASQAVESYLARDRGHNLGTIVEFKPNRRKRSAS